MAVLRNLKMGTLTRAGNSNTKKAVGMPTIIRIASTQNAMCFGDLNDQRPTK